MHAFDACIHSMHASKPGSRKDPGMPILMARTPRPVGPRAALAGIFGPQSGFWHAVSGCPRSGATIQAHSENANSDYLENMHSYREFYCLKKKMLSGLNLGIMIKSSAYTCHR
eukprot:SAG11_NODE_2476_length_3313_cov_4.959241_2_plen_113_part_00